MRPPRFLALSSLLLVALALLLLRPTAPAHAEQQGCTVANNVATVGAPTTTAVRLANPTVNSGEPSSTTTTNGIYTVQPGDTLSKIAAAHGVTVHMILGANTIADPNLIYPGQQIYIPGQSSSSPVVDTDKFVTGLWADGAVVQGETVTLWVQAPEGATVTASRNGQTVYFHPRCGGLQWGLMAFDALWESPGSYPLTLNVTRSDGAQQSSSSSIVLLAGDYWEGPTLQFPADKQALLQPEVIDGENTYIRDRFEAETNPRSAPMWSGTFWRPINTVITGPFGSRGITNGEYTGYHEGLDFRGPTGTPFYASAAGRVVLAENLRVRGGTVFIDHGAGVITGYFHMSAFAVSAGDYVERDQLLGWTGGTGLTTAPHLHWEVRVNNRWVNPFTWLERPFP
ncbi:MAG: peptidoglycan DD-metalloendopeptidase family protein [Anaerolineales bacterium]|nr:peptidoglycan DD-metalloendopeptidase family protein [Anaerolineales bacterium]